MNFEVNHYGKMLNFVVVVVGPDIFYHLTNMISYFHWTVRYVLFIGVKIRNLKVDFKTGGTWRRVGQGILIMHIYDFFIRLSHLVSKCWSINKNCEDGRFLFIRRRFETKRLSRVKKIINIHYQCSLPDPTPSATSLKINFQISDFDT